MDAEATLRKMRPNMETRYVEHFAQIYAIDRALGQTNEQAFERAKASLDAELRKSR